MLVLAYRDFTAETDFDWVELCWVGHVVNSDDVADFRGATIEQAEKNFQQAIDVHIAEFEALEQELKEAV